MLVKLTKPPVVRRIVYINDYMKGIKKGLDREELEELLAESKKRLEREKALAVGRGNPFRKGITKTRNLTYDCKRVTVSMGFVEDSIGLTALGEQYLNASDEKHQSILCESYSGAYPHFGALVSSIKKHGPLILPLRNTPPFRPEVARYGLDTHQVAFDTVRDLATDVGLVNWYTVGKSDERRQYVYLVCSQVGSELDPKYDVYHKDNHLFLNPNEVPLNEFRENLWDNYIDIVNGILGFPVFYSEIRDRVCYDLKISDRLFDKYTEILIEDDEKYNVIWSQGILPRKQDSASMLKSLPPKNIDGNYIIYLKIVRHR